MGLNCGVVMEEITENDNSVNFCIYFKIIDWNDVGMDRPEDNYNIL